MQDIKILKKQLISDCTKCVWYYTKAKVCLQIDRCKQEFMSRQGKYSGDYNESNWTKGLEYSAKVWIHRTTFGYLVYASCQDYCEYFK